MRESGRLLTVGVIGVLLLSGCAAVDEVLDAATVEPAPSWVPPVVAPDAAAERGSGIAGRVDADWLATVSAETGIPERQLAAYAGVTLWKNQTMPECVFSWPTIAAIAAVESDHGRHGGSSVADDGQVSPPIIGIALEGGDTDLIPDSDGGELDGDTEFDRAVGPFQLIPQTWRNWHVDANGDGVEDPQNIDDAAMAAVNYLCRASAPQDTEAGWRAAITAYNSAPSYIDAVARAAASYAEAVAALE
ncbi:lytic transglycosylase domain-containing protein [uncultured Schumannella sp.]|uniref:lytic transglycosylase domain-containing protein n=1 Tax=uncultured Schumannella sp. TaxID=1195956 RepID=UPI0025E52830|nr:transglycosylase SLT domain-containing protein [uncultured Schumannella sp.]